MPDGFQISEVPRLDGYVIIVTGGNSGIGYETTVQLALRGARVYIASRSQNRVHDAIMKMQQTYGTLDLHFLKLDLQDLQSIKATAGEFMQRESRLDILLNNAGIMACPYEETKDGFESQWQTCFLAHHALTLLLMPILKSTASQYPTNLGRVRIVNVSSDAAFLMGPKSINYEHPSLPEATGPFAPWRRYGHCKQASIISAKALNDRYRSQGITAYSLHPGIVKSNLQSNYPGMIGKLAHVAMKVTPTMTALDGCRNSLYCCTSPQAPSYGGRFFVPYGKLDDSRSSKWIDDPQAVNKLWNAANSQLKRHGFPTEMW